MALVSLRQLLDHAAENNYGIPAFNVNNLEQVQAIMQAASEVNAPVIMQASAGAESMPEKDSLNTLSRPQLKLIRKFLSVCIKITDKVLRSAKVLLISVSLPS